VKKLPAARRSLTPETRQVLVVALGKTPVQGVRRLARGSPTLLGVAKNSNIICQTDSNPSVENCKSPGKDLSQFSSSGS